MLIDTNFDFRTDSGGRDPDHASPTLRVYHQALWNKPLPSGETLRLTQMPGKYLVANVGSQQFHLTSDAISNSLTGHRAMKHFIEQMPPEIIKEVKDLGSTIGSRILFPGDMVDGKRTINVSRGLHPKIRDRFDLTLECIRRHYMDEPSPLSETLSRYGEFFNLFYSFDGYLNFFFLQDLVHDGVLKYFNELPQPLIGSPYPRSAQAYEDYASKTIKFLKSRNQRISSQV